VTGIHLEATIAGGQLSSKVRDGERVKKTGYRTMVYEGFSFPPATPLSVEAMCTTWNGMLKSWPETEHEDPNSEMLAAKLVYIRRFLWSVMAGYNIREADIVRIHKSLLNITS
jgi:hypothetical protein